MRSLHRTGCDIALGVNFFFVRIRKQLEKCGELRVETGHKRLHFFRVDDGCRKALGNVKLSPSEYFLSYLAMLNVPLAAPPVEIAQRASGVGGLRE